MKKRNRSGIKLKELVIMFLLLCITCSSFNNLFSQNIKIKPTRQSSLEAFSKGDYEQAYKEFSELLKDYSKDPLYKYYSGICLVKLGRDPSKAESFLTQALQGAAIVKSLPSDALFWLGRAQQMSGRFTEAIESYNTYSDQAGKKVSREQSVPEFIQQCNERKGKLDIPLINPEELVKVEKVEKVENSQDIAKPVAVDTIRKAVIKEPSGRIKLPSAYEKILDEALDLQHKSDSVNNVITGQKKDMEKLAAGEKGALKVKISRNEMLAASFQKSADQKYSEAEKFHINEQEKLPEKEVVPPVVERIIKDSTQLSVNKPAIVSDKQIDTVKNIITDTKKPVDTFTVFEILSKPITDTGAKILVNPEVPPGLIYRIQVAVFRNPVSPSYFKGIVPVFGFRVAGTDRTNYYAGMFRRITDANKALPLVKARGFKDAFIVPFSGNKTVSADRAALLEKEWRKKPIVVLIQDETETAVDTVPPTLEFRVEVTRVPKPLKDDVIEGIKKMAGSRGLVIKNIDDGNIVYLIGKFITFESAAEYAGLLIRNGYRDSKVVAWLGNREIPVETAKQLFDDIK